MSDGTHIVYGGSVRRTVGNVGVDSGTMVIAAGEFPSHEEASGRNWECHDQCVGNYVVSTTGVGDGGYDVAIVEDVNGPTGLEVVFLCPTILTEIERRVDLPKPTDEEYGQFFGRLRDGCPQEVFDKVVAYDDRTRELGNAIWDELFPTIDPANDSTPKVLGEVLVSGQVKIGDPCYGDASYKVDLPPGRYQAVIWEAEYDGWGNRVFRLGIYRYAG